MSSSSGNPVGVVSDLWRYPIKSFQGQRDRRAFVSPFGFLGDRRCVVVDTEDGQPLRAMKTPLLLAYRATFIDADRGEEVAVVTPEGRHVRWDDPSLAQEIGDQLDLEVRLVRAPMGIHDILPIQMVTEASMQQVAEWVGHDPDRRRFRPSIAIDTDQGVPFEEAEWPGHRVAIGDDVVVDVVVATKQTRVVSYDPDTMERTHAIHQAIAQRRENLFGVYCRIVRGGWVQVGDRVTMDPTPLPTA